MPRELPAWVADAERWVKSSLLWRIWERMLEVEFIDRAIALAGKAFVSFFPLVIVVAAFVPPSVRVAILNNLTRHLGIVGTARSSVRNAFTSASDIRKATGVLGLIFTFFFASSFTTALQRLYLRIWRRPRGGSLMSYARGFSWLLGVLAYMALLGGLRAALGSSPLGTLAFGVMALVISVSAWTGTAWLMLLGEVRIRALVVTGLLTALLFTIYTLSAPAWMPKEITSNQNQFGIFGITMAFITWLSGAAICLLIGGTAGVVLVEDSGHVGRISRLGLDEVLAPDAAPALPAPERTTLKRAFTRSDDD